MIDSHFKAETDSTPTTPMAVESNNNTKLRLLRDMTNGEGVRRVVIQTSVKGVTLDSYKEAERQAKSWFFANYDPIIPGLDAEAYTVDALETTECGIMTGRISEEWLECNHPMIRNRSGKFQFGHHTGLNPTEKEPTWVFEFEIVPVRAAH